ncbi:MAG: hypothetical protein KJ947_11575 [Alphaproteobacteria bacterium]|nr:hypothetical protein [Alphaproteobacteria bacterium]MBU1550196.1 hypothetical protein [Alphaproteobacteria bacterium]MBU2337883.1 hypothetical protein [Alphaproteobacteria bacterium]MBU2387863.1 hypothetical protein [Alphaproteobacteria bacterium]
MNAGALKKTATDLLKRTRHAADELRVGLESIRQHIASLNQEKERVKALPPPIETAVERMEQWIDGCAAPARRRLHDATRFTWPSGTYEPPQYTADEHLAAAYLGPFMKQSLTAELEEVYKTTPGISDEDRAERLDHLDGDLLDAELTEESIIREAERAGLALPRRANADPRVVLAPDEFMP